MTRTRALALALGIPLVLGCSGLMGYGQEVGRARVKSGAPFTITVKTTTDEPHSIWFDIDLQSTGAYGVTGTLQAEGQTWKVDLDKSGSPIVGGSGRMTLSWKESNLGGKSSVSGTIYATDLPARPAGDTVVLQGTLTFAKGTKGTVDVVVTD